jgi:hypothetical protein
MPTDDHPNREEVPREEEAAAEGLTIGTHGTGGTFVQLSDLARAPTATP